MKNEEDYEEQYEDEKYSDNQNQNEQDDENEDEDEEAVAMGENGRIGSRHGSQPPVNDYNLQNLMQDTQSNQYDHTGDQQQQVILQGKLRPQSAKPNALEDASH